MLIFLTNRLIFGKEDSFKAFQRKKNVDIFDRSFNFWQRGLL